MSYSIYGGTGFVGGNFCRLFSDDVVLQERDERKPNTNQIIYFISTVDNYNVHNNITLDVETNLKVLCEVLDFCRDSNFIFNFISSWFVYGETKLPAKEEYYCNPTGFYSITKKAAEDLLISFCKTYGVKYRILRLCNVMGNGDGKVSAKKNALSYMIDLLKKNEDVYLYEGKFNEIYNIGSGQATPISAIIETAKEYLGSTSKIKSKEAPEFHKIVQAKDFWMDTTKLNRLGFTRNISNEQIIQELCQ